MNNFFKAIGREWERNLLMTIAAVIACVGGYYAYQYLNHEEDAESGTKKKPELPSYYEVALLDGTAVPAMQDGVNPMSCEFKKPEPPKPPPPKPWQLPKLPKPEVKPQPPKPEVKPQPPKPEVKPQPPKPEVKPQPPKPEVKPQPPKPEVKPQPPTPKPKPKPPRVVELRYIGNMSIDGGNAAAQLYVSEVISKKQKNSFKARLRVGEKVLGGLLEIKSFDKNRVVLVHSGNKEVKVPIRQKKPTVVSIPQ